MGGFASLGTLVLLDGRLYLCPHQTAKGWAQGSRESGRLALSQLCCGGRAHRPREESMRQGGLVESTHRVEGSQKLRWG